MQLASLEVELGYRKSFALATSIYQEEPVESISAWLDQEEAIARSR